MRDYGLTVEVSIYAILATGAQDEQDATTFIFEEDENTGLMRHEFVSPDSHIDGSEDPEDPINRLHACMIC